MTFSAQDRLVKLVVTTTDGGGIEAGGDNAGLILPLASLILSRTGHSRWPHSCMSKVSRLADF